VTLQLFSRVWKLGREMNRREKGAFLEVRRILSLDGAARPDILLPNEPLLRARSYPIPANQRAPLNRVFVNFP
jgi:hypothetical protein